MVTKAKLLEGRRKREAEAKAKKKKAEQKSEQWRREYEAEKCEHVKTLVKGALGELIQKMDEEGVTDIRLGNRSRVWKPYEFNDKWTQAYGNECPLTFDPVPDKKYTKMLITRLRRAGFSAKVETEEHQNYEYVTTADGYDIEDRPGTHEVHFLRISW